MFLKKKAEWETVENFDPKKAGFRFDVSANAVDSLRGLVRKFDLASPKPGHVHEFISVLIMGGADYYQILEELKRRSWDYDVMSLTRDKRLWGFQVVLGPIDGFALGLNLDLAPNQLREQIYFQEKERRMLEEEARARAEIEEAIQNGEVTVVEVKQKAEGTPSDKEKLH